LGLSRPAHTIKDVMGVQDSRGSQALPAAPRLKRALVVEDDEQLRRTLESALRPWALETRSAGNLVEARRQMSEFRPELLVLDFMLPDGTAAELLASARLRAPLPAIVALSAYARPRDSFALAQLGVRAYLEKPVDLTALDEALGTALSEPPDLDLSARQAVGHVHLPDAEEALRRTMVEEALDRSGGNRRGAARLLGISRELLQHVLKKLRD
jgi:two-component system, response regulator RegA